MYAKSMTSGLNEAKFEKMKRRIHSLRKSGKGWDEIRLKINEEFENKYNNEKIKELYNEHIAKSLIISQEASKQRIHANEVKMDWDKRLEEKLLEIDKWVHRLMTVFTTIFEKAVKEGDEAKINKYAPTILTISREILSQIMVIRKQQEAILNIQKNQIIYSPQQIYQQVNKYMSEKEKEEGYSIHPVTGAIVKNKKKITA